MLSFRFKRKLCSTKSYLYKLEKEVFCFFPVTGFLGTIKKPSILENMVVIFSAHQKRFELKNLEFSFPEIRILLLRRVVVK